MLTLRHVTLRYVKLENRHNAQVYSNMHGFGSRFTAEMELSG